MTGSTLFLIAGMALILRTGPIRALRIGLMPGAAGCLGLMLSPSGMALGAAVPIRTWPIGPAASKVLPRHAPAARRSLMVSGTQAGRCPGAWLPATCCRRRLRWLFGWGWRGGAGRGGEGVATQVRRAAWTSDAARHKARSVAGFPVPRDVLAPSRAVIASSALPPVAAAMLTSGCRGVVLRRRGAYRRHGRAGADHALGGASPARVIRATTPPCAALRSSA